MSNILVNGKDVFIDGLNINKELVKSGNCWVYRKYSKDKDMIKLEDTAKHAKLGLWGLPEHQRLPPWEFRRLRRKK